MGHTSKTLWGLKDIEARMPEQRKGRTCLGNLGLGELSGVKGRLKARAPEKVNQVIHKAAIQQVKQTQTSQFSNKKQQQKPSSLDHNSTTQPHNQDFHTFCVDTVGGDTGETMGEILKTRADTTAINITLNSFGTALNEPSMRGSDRKRLYPSFGHLYPAGTNMLATVSDEEGLGNVLNSFPQYAFAWSAHSNDAGDNKSIDDAFYERDVQMLELAFEGQFHFGPFYAYVKLKEQEIRNLVWITECILQGQKEEINNYVPIFDMNSSWRSGKR